MATTKECTGQCEEGCPNPECVNICYECGEYCSDIVVHPDGVLTSDGTPRDVVKGMCCECSVNEEGVPHCSHVLSGWDDETCGWCDDRWQEMYTECSFNCDEKCPHPACPWKEFREIADVMIHDVLSTLEAYKEDDDENDDEYEEFIYQWIQKWVYNASEEDLDRLINAYGRDEAITLSEDIYDDDIEDMDAERITFTLSCNIMNEVCMERKEYG